MKKTKIWLILFSLLLIISVGCFLILKHSGGLGTIATVKLDGEVVERIDLAAVVTPYEIELRGEYGYNLLLVEPGAISVAEADCPDLVCVHQGSIEGPGIPIVCMPHRLVIEIEGEP